MDEQKHVFVDVSKTVCCEPLVFSIIPESRFFAMQMIAGRMGTKSFHKGRSGYL